MAAGLAFIASGLISLLVNELHPGNGHRWGVILSVVIGVVIVWSRIF